MLSVDLEHLEEEPDRPIRREQHPPRSSSSFRFRARCTPTTPNDAVSSFAFTRSPPPRHRSRRGSTGGSRRRVRRSAAASLCLHSSGLLFRLRERCTTAPFRGGKGSAAVSAVAHRDRFPEMCDANRMRQFMGKSVGNTLARGHFPTGSHDDVISDQETKILGNLHLY